MDPVTDQDEGSTEPDEGSTEPDDSTSKAEPETSPGAEVIRPLEEEIGCPVIVYYATLPMRRGDARALYDLLEDLGPQDEAAFVVQSPGGDSDTAHYMATLIREYLKYVRVYVPTYASSAATLFCLYADEIWMGPNSELSPIDPQVPVDPRLIIPRPEVADGESNSDVTTYLPAHVIRDFLELTGVLETTSGRRRKSAVHPERFETLLKPLNPWVLGWYERADKVSRVYAKEALVNHLLIGKDDRDRLADEIVEKLMDFYASHDASIVRSEARRIGIPVKDCPPPVWDSLSGLSEFYRKVLQTQKLGRILETKTRYDLLPATAHRQCGACFKLSVAKENYSYCPYCGNLFFEHCNQCQHPLEDEWDFCPVCGRDLDEPASPAP